MSADLFAEPERTGWRIVNAGMVDVMPGIVFISKRAAVAAIRAMMSRS